ncbi:MAG: hypothetical protein QM581_14095 [Pseudomonas sp.]
MAWARATLIAAVDADGEHERLHAWLDRWRLRRRTCSDNTGCGCRVDMFEVVAPVEALAELPARMRSHEAAMAAD